MPKVRVTDSDGIGHSIFGEAVMGIAINNDNYGAKMVCKELEDGPKLIQAIVKYLSDINPEELKKAIKKYRIKTD